MAQTVGYLLAAAGPALLGVVHDLTGSWTAPLAALTGATVVILLVGLGAGRDALVAPPPTTAAPVPAGSSGGSGGLRSEAPTTGLGPPPRAER